MYFHERPRSLPSKRQTAADGAFVLRGVPLGRHLLVAHDSAIAKYGILPTAYAWVSTDSAVAGRIELRVPSRRAIAQEICDGRAMDVSRFVDNPAGAMRRVALKAGGKGIVAETPGRG